MRKFSIKIWRDLEIWHNHYLSTEFIENECVYFKKNYSLMYRSRKFDKPAGRRRGGTCVWKLGGKLHRLGKPAWISSSGRVEYWENGKRVK